MTLRALERAASSSPPREPRELESPFIAAAPALASPRTRRTLGEEARATNKILRDARRQSR